MSYSYEIKNDKIVEYFNYINHTPFYKEKIKSWYLSIFKEEIQPILNKQPNFPIDEKTILSFYIFLSEKRFKSLAQTMNRLALLFNIFFNCFFACVSY
jgi:hypothetical protein